MQTWDLLLKAEHHQPYFLAMQKEIAKQRQAGINIYPEDNDIFNAFKLTPFEQVKVVVLGQDPYHGEGQAHGLAFSVQDHVKPPPSLANMYKELATDISNFTIPKSGNLSYWAEQGVLLLNTVLTVQQANAHSHAKLGWETYTDTVIDIINQQKKNVVFILWGAHAQKKGKLIDSNKHKVLMSVHPSPLSAYRGFFGCQHFSQTNQYLQSTQQTKINWLLTDLSSLN
ncbi:uracil-DNA glycosylase [Colwelliaceae bacterium BS250]